MSFFITIEIFAFFIKYILSFILKLATVNSFAVITTAAITVFGCYYLLFGKQRSTLGPLFFVFQLYFFLGCDFFLLILETRLCSQYLKHIVSWAFVSSVVNCFRLKSLAMFISC